MIMYENLANNIDIAPIQEKIFGAMGLAKRAGKLTTGAEMCEETIRAGKSQIAFLCSNMSENSQKKIHAALKNADSPYIVLNATKEELAKKFGKKAYVTVCALTDKSFANIVYKALGIAEDRLLH